MRPTTSILMTGPLCVSVPLCHVDIDTHKKGQAVLTT